MKIEDIKFPYGAVYYRYSNPPERDWERDYQTAAQDGITVFRHWFLWSAIEVKPGKYDWSGYDRQLELAAKNNIKTIIAEMLTAAPEWAFRMYSQARYQRKDGSRINSQMSGSCVTGGFPGLCLDNEEIKERAEAFLKELARRYKDHPALLGYDIWNECNIGADICYCPATVKEFRKWLKNKYNNLESLAYSWYRPSFSDWEDVKPPTQIAPYPEVLDWLQFRVGNAYRLMKWRIDQIKEIDPEHLITAHGVAGTLSSMATRAADDWLAAKNVEAYGFTWVASRKGNEPWKQWHAVDLVRAAAKGKPFWHAEAQGGPLWMQPQVINRTRDDGRITKPEDLRLWNMVSFAGGSTGLLYPRWRPLLDGPLFGAFGPYGMDGLRTPRSKMMSTIAKWAQDENQQSLWQSRPIKGDIGIIYVPESQIYCYAQQGNTNFYAQSMEGVYQGFFDNNIQSDWVHLDDIDEYEILYLPYPVMLTEESTNKIEKWVKQGGYLISEGCPGYFGYRGRVGTVQPNLGLGQVFGAREDYIEFTPDLLNDLIFIVDGKKVYGGLYKQAYKITTGKVGGRYLDDRIAVVENEYGMGKVKLIGTFPGAGYFLHPGENKEFFSDILLWAGKEQKVKVSDNRITARLHSGPGGTYLWVVNHFNKDLTVKISLSSEWNTCCDIKIIWGSINGIKDITPELEVRVGKQNVIIAQLI